jgi:translation initiation factor IF-2
MKISDIAKEFNTTNEFVLSKLRALKLKAKDGKQELNKVVEDVVRRAILKEGKDLPRPEKKPLPEPEPKSVKAKETLKIAEEKPKIKATILPSKQPPPAKELKEAETKKKKTPDIIEKKITPKPVKKEKAVSEEAKPTKEKEKPVEAPFVPLKPLVKKKKRPSSMAEGGKFEVKPEGVGMTVAEKGTGIESGMVVAAKEVIEPRIETVIPAQTKVLPELELKVPISVKDFAVAIQQKTSAILKRLMEMGIFANINQNLAEDVVRELTKSFGFQLTKVKTQEQQLIEEHRVEEEDQGSLETRAPVVTLMGHVDHGKTSLLDRIRRSRVAEKEHGGITQHIGAYLVNTNRGRIAFLDTPGHEAFTAMRARGAHITDIVVLVVAADEGIMPQTDEAIDHARAAEVPIVVALNKIDHKDADPDRVKKQLADRGLNPEDWGGKTIVVGVSALTGEGVDNLLEMILLEAELLELKANRKKHASGIVVEAHLSRGKGSLATLIVQSGTLNLNDIIVVGPYYGKVKAMFDDLENSISTAGPSMPVEILGLPGVPDAGEMFYVVEDEKRAKEITGLRQDQLKSEKLHSARKITLEDLYTRIKEGQIRELNVILKADVQGSLEALKDSLERIPSTEVKVKFIHTGTGDVNVSDVILAVASDAIIIGFQVGLGPKVDEEVEKSQVDVRLYRIIYDAVNDVRKALEGLLEPKKRKKFLSRIEVRQVFKLSKAGIVAGCFVLKGKVNRKAKVDLIRNGEIVFSGNLSSLKRFKDDVREVGEGFECGITVANFDGIQPGDIIEAYEVETIARTL